MEGSISLNRKSGVALYVQVRETLRRELDQMADGQSLPSEAAIEQRFSVSRITVRKALEDLASEGLLTRQPGKGTFARKPKYTHYLNAITSWTEQIRALGYEPSTARAKLETTVHSEYFAAALQMPEGEPAVKLRRLRLASGEPISLMVHYIPEELVPGLADTGLQSESLYEHLEKTYDLTPALASDTVETREAKDQEAEFLEIRPRSPVIFVTRISYLEDGTPLEFVTVASRGDRYRYKVALTGRVPSLGDPFPNHDTSHDRGAIDTKFDK